MSIYRKEVIILEFKLVNNGSIRAYDMFTFIRPDHLLALDEIEHKNALLLVRDHNYFRKIIAVRNFETSRHSKGNDELIFDIKGYLSTTEINKLRKRSYVPIHDNDRNLNMCLDLWGFGPFFNSKSSADIIFFDLNPVKYNRPAIYRYWKSMTKLDNQDVIIDLE